MVLSIWNDFDNDKKIIAHEATSKHAIELCYKNGYIRLYASHEHYLQFHLEKGAHEYTTLLKKNSDKYFKFWTERIEGDIILTTRDTVKFLCELCMKMINNSIYINNSCFNHKSVKPFKSKMSINLSTYLLAINKIRIEDVIKYQKQVSAKFWDAMDSFID